MKYEYYGNDKSHKPNEHCFWDDLPFYHGWYETEDHFRMRFFKSLTNYKMDN